MQPLNAKRIGQWIAILAIVAIHSFQFQQDAYLRLHPYRGITLIRRSISKPHIVKMCILQIDLTAPGIRFRLTPPAGNREVVNQTTLHYMIQQQAQFAVNVHFYLPVGAPESDLIGLAVSNGIVYSAFENPVQAYALVDDAPGMNIDPDNKASIVHVDQNYPDKKHILENARLWNAFSGSAQIVTNGIKTIPVYRDAMHPDGLLTPDSKYSNGHSWYDILNPRTTIGLSKDNRKLIILVADGRKAGGSLGLTGEETADILINDYGAFNALNLDGGGSSALAMKDPVTGLDRIINVSSDGRAGRAVGSNLAIYAEIR
jgi:exopolysaccharide biosynthesis protein